MYYYFCDGASRNNGNKQIGKPVLGSYAGVLVNEDNLIIKKFSNKYKDVTNNQMELLGFINPMLYIITLSERNNITQNIHVVSDSQYLIKGINEWLPGWKRKGWKNSTGKVIENIELWKIIDKILHNSSINLTFEHVKGHSKNPKEYSYEYYNNICDENANICIDDDNTKVLSFNESLNSIKNLLF